MTTDPKPEFNTAVRHASSCVGHSYKPFVYSCTADGEQAAGGTKILPRTYHLTQIRVLCSLAGLRLACCFPVGPIIRDAQAALTHVNKHQVS